jgi:hypothetical protein
MNDTTLRLTEGASCGVTAKMALAGPLNCLGMTSFTPCTTPRLLPASSTSTEATSSPTLEASGDAETLVDSPTTLRPSRVPGRPRHQASSAPRWEHLPLPSASGFRNSGPMQLGTQPARWRQRCGEEMRYSTVNSQRSRRRSVSRKRLIRS